MVIDKDLHKEMTEKDQINVQLMASSHFVMTVRDRTRDLDVMKAHVQNATTKKKLKTVETVSKKEKVIDEDNIRQPTVEEQMAKPSFLNKIGYKFRKRK